MVATAELKGVIRLQQGSKVQVNGLQKRSELNGLIGRCLQFDAAKMRWGVELPDGQQISLRIGNILPVGAEVERAVESGPRGVPAPEETGAAELTTVDSPIADKPKPAGTGSEEEAGMSGPQKSLAAAESEAGGQVVSGVEVKGEARSPDAENEEAQGSGAPDLDLDLDLSGPTPAEACNSEGAGFLGCGGEESRAEAEAPKTGRWFEHEAASEHFAEQLSTNDPALTSLCLVPPKRFEEEDVERISEGLEVSTHCKELLASGHRLSERSCRRLAEMLRLNSSLELLSVGDASLGDSACLIFEGLAENISLKNLDLELKGLTEAAGAALAVALAKRAERGAERLETLRLARNPGLGASLVKLADSPAPRELLLFDAALGEERAPDLGRWVAGGIEDLDLRDNSRLGAEGLELLLGSISVSAAPSAASPARLRRLRLDGCAVGDDGLEVLAESVRGGQLLLEDLFLERCEITSLGCEHLERAFLGRRLQSLSLRTNLVGDAGCSLLADSAQRLDLGANNVSALSMATLGEKAITSLELFNNPLLGQSVAAWCPELRSEHWRQLEHLDLSACLLGDDGFRLLCSALKQRPELMPQLTSLCLGGNEVKDSDEFNDLAEGLTVARGGKLRVFWKNT